MTNEQAKSELMQIYMSLSEEKKQALDVLMAQNCDQCEVGNPCLYCEYEFKAKADRNEFYNWDAPIRHKADGEYISKSKMLMFLNDMRFGIAPDETVADDDERREREAQVDVLDDLMEVVEQMPTVSIPPNHDGCKDCRYQDKGEDELPCRECQQNYKDKWEKAPQWIHTEECDEEFPYRCSKCNLPSRSNGHRYCPNCGSYMYGHLRKFRMR